MKAEELVNWFRDKDGVLIAFSGGVDSSVLAKAAHLALGDKAIAGTAKSSTLLEREFELAKGTASEIGIRHVVFEEDELADEKFVENPPERCYHCRKGLIKGLNEVAGRYGVSCIVDGANADDINQHRPGLKAMRENGVRSPLLELGITKEGVREIADHFGLSVRDKPSMACLASRIPYGEPITREKLAMIEGAEDCLCALGFEQVRVRHHDGMARIEVPVEDIPRILEVKQEVAERLRELGFSYVTLDLEGYRSGSMDEVLPKRGVEE